LVSTTDAFEIACITKDNPLELEFGPATEENAIVLTSTFDKNPKRPGELVVNDKEVFAYVGVTLIN
jgi:hypothetical protein